MFTIEPVLRQALYRDRDFIAAHLALSNIAAHLALSNISRSATSPRISRSATSRAQQHRARLSRAP